jgi:hypothetical protein
MREPESIDPLLQGIRRRNRRLFIATVLVFVLPLGYVARSCAVSTSHSYNNFENRFVDRERYEHDLTAAQRATITTALAEAKARDTEHRNAWRAAIDAAVAGGITERPDLGPCPTKVFGPSRIKGELPSMPSWLTVAKTPADVARTEPAIGWSREREANSLEERSKRGNTDRDAEKLVKDALAFSADDAWTYDVLMVIDRTVAAVSGTKAKEFTSGEIDGRAYLYDYRKKAVTCAGRVHAENSDEVRFTYTRRFGDPSGGSISMELEQALANDLTIEEYRAAADAVHFRAGPPLQQEP